MEEVDLSLRLFASGKNMIVAHSLRVFHDTDLSHHQSWRVTAASISNLALLSYLRYPVKFWPYGAAQVANRVAWLLRAGRWRGIATGIREIPRSIWTHRRERKAVSSKSVTTFLQARASLETAEPLQE